MPKKVELTLDDLLAVLGNPLRREILERVTKETHYPLQLSKELKVSQQAIMKHLTVLERSHLVRCRELKSTSHGPPRKCYVSTGQFSISIDFGPSTFETRFMPLDSEGEDEDAEFPPEDDVEGKDTRQEVAALKEISSQISGVNAEMGKLEDHRAALAAHRQELLRDAVPTINRIGRNYEERRFLFLLLEHPEKSIEEIVEEAQIPPRSLERLHRLLFGDGEG